MDFLNKIKSYISRGGVNQWKKEVQNEKKKKYLFGGADEGDSFKRSRNKNIFLGKNDKFNAFTRFFQDKIITGDIFETYGYIMSMIGVGLMLMTGYIVILSPYFKISPNHVIIEPTPGIDIAIAYRTLESTYGESIFLIDEAVIAKKLKNQLNNIASIDIRTVYPNGIKILITGTPILFDTTITGIENKKWGLSKNGVLVPESDLEGIKPKYQLNISSKSLIGDFFLNYKTGVGEYNMIVISKIFEIFSSEWGDMKLARSNYFLAENELHIKLESGTKIIFALQSDADKTPGTIPKSILDQLITLRTYITNNRSKITDGSVEYIDTRIPGKIFICSDKGLCPKNLTIIYGDTYK